MTYVDTEVLAETLEILRDEWAPVNNGYIAINEVLEYVKEMPAVDAIPVSYILDKMSVINSEYININRQIDREPRSVDGLVGVATNLLHEYNTLRNLIKEWEGK